MDMNLKRTSEPIALPMEDITFATHALAVIDVHSSQGGGSKLTIRQIAKADPYLANKEARLLFSMMCAFGQHAVPVFEKLLTDCGRSTDRSVHVAEIRKRLSSNA